MAVRARRGRVFRSFHSISAKFFAGGGPRRIMFTALGTPELNRLRVAAGKTLLLSQIVPHGISMPVNSGARGLRGQSPNHDRTIT